MTASLEDRAEAEAGYTPQLAHVEIGDILAATIDPPQFAVEKIVPRRVATLLGAHGGAGKSILALIICAHFAVGRNWAGLHVDQGRAVFVSLEDSGDLVLYRLRRIVEAYGLNADAVSRNMVIVDGTAGDPTLFTELNMSGDRRVFPTAVMEEVQDLATGAGLVVVDNASDAYGANENERRHVKAFIRVLASIARTNDAGLILLAHIDKVAARNGGSGNNYSGSTAWHNSVRSRLALVESEVGVELHQEKLNLGQKADPITLRWNEHGVLVPASVRNERTDQQEDADVDAVLAAIRAATAVCTDVSAARTGSSTSQTVLATFGELPPRLHGTRGRRAFWAAVDALLKLQRIKVEEVRGANRHIKKCLVLIEAAESARADPPHPLHAAARAPGSGSAPDCANSFDAELAQTSAVDCTAEDYRKKGGD